jgi:hypothetical protein
MHAALTRVITAAVVWLTASARRGTSASAQLAHGAMHASFLPGLGADVSTRPQTLLWLQAL